MMKRMGSCVLIFALTTTLLGCVGLDPKNEGFGENAAEVARRTVMGVMTLGISEMVEANDRKQQRERAMREENYRKWYDGLPDTEKNIEDMKQAHRYQLMGTIMQNRPMPTFTVPPPPAYYAPSAGYDGTNQRRTTNCTSNVSGNQVYTNCY